ncbi:hypothetical protein ACMHYJ_02325 [Castellaniella hirudinis]|uniref:hypothetical protein n=1 Tax=Castellaniella hirudinis TaxID=1144617 RepID=UPI0039C0D7EA
MKSHRAYSDHEIACYVLGLDMREQAQDIQARLARDDAAAARALKWEAYFLDIVDGLPASPPPPELLTRVQNSLGMEYIAFPGETRPGHQPEAGTAASPPAEDHKPRGRSPRPRKRLMITAGLCVATGLLVLLTWASLRPTPSTVLQQDIQLPGQTQS